MSQVGDGVAEMLCDALLATKRYIVQMRKSSDAVIKSQEVREGRRHSKEEEIDLLVEGVIKEFNPGIPGAGDRTGGTSYVTIIVTVTDPRTSQMLATEKVKGKATEFGGTSGRRGALPEVFRISQKHRWRRQYVPPLSNRPVLSSLRHRPSLIESEPYLLRRRKRQNQPPSPQKSLSPHPRPLLFPPPRLYGTP
jgi:hypothetical protein